MKATKIILLVFILVIVCLPPPALYFSGIVLDAETKEPLENVVVSREWNKRAVTPAGSVSLGGAIRETLTDKKGRFAIFMAFVPHIPLIQYVSENEPAFYKPGYKYTLLEKRIPIFHRQKILLEKVSTTIEDRQIEYNKARDRYTAIRRIKEDYFIRCAKSITKNEKSLAKSAYGFIIHSPFRPSWVDVSNYKAYNAVYKRSEKCENVSSPEKRQSLLDALQNGEKGTRLVAAKAISQVCIDDPDSMNKLEKFAALQLKMLSDKSETDKIIPAVYIGRLGQSVVKPLIAALESDNLELKRFAIRALAETRGPSDLDALIDQFVKNDQYQNKHFHQLNPTQRNYLYRLRGGKEGLFIDEYLVGTKNGGINTRQLHAMASTRLLVIKSLKYIDSPKALAVLLRALKDHDSKIRWEAALSLGYIGAISTIQPLIEALRGESPNIRRPVERALIIIGKPAVEALIRALESDDPGVRESAANSLRYADDQRALDALIKAASGSETDASVLEKIIVALSEFKDPKGAACLIKNSNHDSMNVRKAAMAALKKIQIRSTALQKPSKFNDRSPYVRKSIIDIIDEKAMKLVLEDWHSDSYKYAKPKITVDFLTHKGPEVIDPLLILLKQPDPFLKWRSAWVLGEMHFIGAEKSIIPLLQDKAPEVKWMAAKVLGVIGSINSIEPLRELLDDKDSGISTQAGSALQKIISREYHPDVLSW